MKPNAPSSSSAALLSIYEENNFTPAKHLIPPPNHSSRPVAAHTDTETPLQ